MSCSDVELMVSPIAESAPLPHGSSNSLASLEQDNSIPLPILLTYEAIGVVLLLHASLEMRNFALSLLESIHTTDTANEFCSFYSLISDPRSRE